MSDTAPSQQETSHTYSVGRFLYLTAAINGGVILIIEILGAKMLSPFFGTSHFVWTAQIASTLISLACGYYFGGWLADRKPKLDGLFLCMGGRPSIWHLPPLCWSRWPTFSWALNLPSDPS